MYCITEYIQYITYRGDGLGTSIFRASTYRYKYMQYVAEYPYEMETAALIKVPDGPAARYKGNASTRASISGW